MSVTKRFILIISAGFLLLIPIFNPKLNNFIFIGYNLVCFCLLGADYFISPKASHFTITRDSKRALMFNAENIISFSVKSSFNKPIMLTLQDELPSFHFTVVSDDMVKEVISGEGIIFSYNVIPLKRGNFKFNNLYLKYSGILGLCNKYETISLSSEYRVYPNVQKIQKHSNLAVKNSVYSSLITDRQFNGASSQFDSLKDYSSDDEFKNINWNASSRCGKLIANLYETEKSRPIYILLDTGRNMNYMWNKNLKLDYAINESIILSDVANKSGNSSSLVVFNDSVKTYVKPGRRDTHRTELVNALYSAEGCNLAPNYLSAFNSIIKQSKGFAFIFTDFETRAEAEDLIAQIKSTRLQSFHIPVIALIKSAAIEDMLRSDDIYERHVAAEYLDNRQRIIRYIAKAGVDCAEISPYEL